MHPLLEALIDKKNTPGTGHNGTDIFVQQTLMTLDELYAMTRGDTSDQGMEVLAAILKIQDPLLTWQRLRKELR